MGTSNGLEDFNRKLALLTGAAFADMALRAHRRIGLRTKYDLVPAAGKPDTGGDMVLSRYGSTARRRGKVRLSARFTADADRVRIMPTPPAPWALLEFGSRKPEWQEPRARRGRSSGPRRFIATGPDTAYAHITHPRLAGKRTWSRVRGRVADVAPGIVDAEVVRALRKAFG